ncbi:hypothetical protein P152DRAFT_335261 [Eremomyces bilateralis CBS 781.70]|uniref:Uncharacterized protein n=1 Tax=Eremomyces bilateralis CBS 781.70 TaxID=1392243 RepID=A0A6G1G4M5_9PEZI|nr:uncharacterized protein P152DRAFT_335261 [Eremomyces bilateralis CBS 781.70]KAF1813013.1 hypothetical protein P152DRAFT_335261 [Eremomyces bilateralis CBS 781.70]
MSTTAHWPSSLPQIPCIGLPMLTGILQVGCTRGSLSGTVLLIPDMITVQFESKRKLPEPRMFSDIWLGISVRLLNTILLYTFFYLYKPNPLYYLTDPSTTTQAILLTSEDWRLAALIWLPLHQLMSLPHPLSQPPPRPPVLGDPSLAPHGFHAASCSHSPHPPFPLSPCEDFPMSMGPQSPRHPAVDAAEHLLESLPPGMFPPSYTDSRRPKLPFPPSPNDPFMMSSCPSSRCSSTRDSFSSGPPLDELVRRTNLAVQLVNSQLTISSRYAQMQPKMCTDGRFPEDFKTAKTLEEVRVIDPSTLDRILSAYNLPTDLRSLRMTSRDPFSPKMAHLAKLCTLLDFLGATQVAEADRMRRAAVMVGY